MESTLNRLLDVLSWGSIGILTMYMLLRFGGFYLPRAAGIIAVIAGGLILARYALKLDELESEVKYIRRRMRKM